MRRRRGPGLLGGTLLYGMRPCHVLAVIHGSLEIGKVPVDF